uniref:non-specific serine/threonine protein kinase n=1 Tax=Quercus lobata TaxID=97700 RepID=A0A7N2MBZ8_QUELO
MMTLISFKPVSADAWSNGNSSSTGCLRETALQCTKNIDVQKDGFFSMSIIDWPDNRQHRETDNPTDCQSACLNNCSCVAYAYYYIKRDPKNPKDPKLQCFVWHGALLNLKQRSTDDINGIDFYLKLASSDLVKLDANSRNETSIDTVNNNSISSTNFKFGVLQILVLTLSTPFAMLTLGLLFYYVRRKLRKKGEDLLQLDVGMTQTTENSELSEVSKPGDGKKKEVKMPLFSLKSVSAATDNFSDANKLGEGGFGPVYKGILQKGDEVAVKRLSKRSGQGCEELKNEAMLIAKLQHKNLVRLLGCCIERDEKILVYEYMSNKSLDFFLFDPEKSKILDWGTRLRVIEGVSQGLLYLHQYSWFKIIHRDLKASNILLDSDMNPKISDFGMARIFGGNDSQANTNRIVGTYGYMSPEYALEGLFSIKSDVFSFGILLLEIVSGQKNTGFYPTDSCHLLGYAWELWTNERGSDLVDPLLDDVCSMHVALRCINIALLCVQESAADRPAMSEVVTMLSNESVALPCPKQPGFLNVGTVVKENQINSMTGICSVNHASISIVQGR